LPVVSQLPAKESYTVPGTMNGAVRAMTSSLVALLPSADVSALGDLVYNISSKITTENAPQACDLRKRIQPKVGLNCLLAKRLTRLVIITDLGDLRHT